VPSPWLWKDGNGWIGLLGNTWKVRCCCSEVDGLQTFVRR